MGANLVHATVLLAVCGHQTIPRRTVTQARIWTFAVPQNDACAMPSNWA
jgi:hypothetical protein